jgi:HD-GYP domain-containing protein (c-di-GMP phosphodiesterase class II)
MGYRHQQLELTMPRGAAGVAPWAREIVTAAEPAELDLLARVHDAFEVREGEAAAHVHRMAAVAGLLAERLGLSPSEAWTMRAAASLHDIGKLTLSAAVLLKPGALNPAERAAVQRHPVAGHQMLSEADTPIFRLAATIALTHHEHWDGNGYPIGLHGTEIPQAGRIAAVADVFDALLSDRPYRPAFGLDRTAAALQSGRGTQFDPDVIDALFENLGEALAAR